MLKPDKRKRDGWLILGSVLLVALVGIADYVTGPDMEFGVVYLAPILLGAAVNMYYGGIISLGSALVGLLTDIILAHHGRDIVWYAWNFSSHLTIYLVVAFSFAGLLQSKQHESELARTDSLTGAMNARAFYERVETEIYRAGRYNNALGLVYFDVDNFKFINDTFGHKMGDRLLCTIVTVIKRHIRKADALARLGGDEFALLLSATDQEAAQVTLDRIQDALKAEMQQNHWPVTFSIGVLICEQAQQDVDELIKLVDEVMYSVKRESKNGIKYAHYAG